MAEPLAGQAAEPGVKDAEQRVHPPEGEEPGDSGGPPAGLWKRLYADPEYAPEYLAMAAVERLGPEAQRWVAEERARQPDITAEELAERARRRFVRMSRASGAVAGVTGIVGAVADIGFLTWQQARMVLHIAAAHGADPTHEDRATDLLVLQGMYSAVVTARAALQVARGRAPVQAVFEQHGGTASRAMMKLAMNLARMAGIRAVRRLASRVVPGAAVVFGALGNARATNDLARRAAEWYGKSSADGTKPSVESKKPSLESAENREDVPTREIAS